MCNCGAKRRAATTRAIPTVTAPPPPPATRSLPVSEPPPPPTRFHRRRHRRFGGPTPPPTEPSFHLPIVDTNVWGPRLWTVLHVASVAVTCGEIWPRLVEELKMGLPCPDCTTHYTAWAVAQPVTATTDMSAWFLALHNDVNRRIGGRNGWTCEALMVTYTGQLDSGRTALDALRGVIGEAAWITLDAILVAAVTAVADVTSVPVV